jgi:putative ABC transport system ATP-binding protein
VSATELKTHALGLDLGGRVLMDDIELTARAGLPLAVSGPSGSGKTLLLLVLAGLIVPTRGTISLDEVTVDGTQASDRARFGVILQSQGLVMEMTAEENIALPLQQRALGAAEVATRTSDALAAVGLDQMGDRMAGELSGGQRQRVGVARALAGSPEIVIADEPTAELDPDNRARILSLLLEPPSPRIVVVASNDPEVSRACHTTIHLRDGRLDPGGERPHQ